MTTNLHAASSSMAKSTRALAGGGGVVTLLAIVILSVGSAPPLRGMGLLLLPVAAALMFLAGAGLLSVDIEDVLTLISRQE